MFIRLYVYEKFSNNKLWSWLVVSYWNILLCSQVLGLMIFQINTINFLVIGEMIAMKFRIFAYFSTGSVRWLWVWVPNSSMPGKTTKYGRLFLFKSTCKWIRHGLERSFHLALWNQVKWDWYERGGIKNQGNRKPGKLESWKVLIKWKVWIRPGINLI